MFVALAKDAKSELIHTKEINKSQNLKKAIKGNIVKFIRLHSDAKQLRTF